MRFAIPSDPAFRLLLVIAVAVICVAGLVAVLLWKIGRNSQSETDSYIGRGGK